MKKCCLIHEFKKYGYEDSIEEEQVTLLPGHPVINPR